MRESEMELLRAGDHVPEQHGVQRKGQGQGRGGPRGTAPRGLDSEPHSRQATMR